jgi:RNA polymerase sigma factor (TIGR02999 family)
MAEQVRYRSDVLEHLLRHGIRPTAQTSPELVRDFVRDLYKYEIRCLRERYMRREFPKLAYAGRVDALRRRYPVLSLKAQEFVEACADHTPQPPAARELAPLVYDELRRLAAAYMRRERPGQTLQATALVHEAYLRLAGAGTPWHDERHFVGIAARSMRQILVERARARGAQKRWAGLDRVSMTDALAVATDPVTMLPALDEALTRLEEIDAEQARIVDLRYFAGLSIEDTADALGISPATLKRRWALARAWLFREMSGV